MTEPDSGRPGISPRTAALLARDPALRRLRIRYRADKTIYRDLLAITMVGLAYEARNGRVTGLAIDLGPPEDQNMTPRQAAALAGVRPAAIRRAAREGRIAASTHRGKWAIPATAAVLYARQRDGN